jgi:hypothetical protein
MIKNARRLQGSPRMALLVSFAWGLSAAACGGGGGGGSGGSGGKGGAGGTAGPDAAGVKLDVAPAVGTGGTTVIIMDAGATGGTSGADARDASMGGNPGPEAGIDVGTPTGGAGGTTGLDGGRLDTALPDRPADGPADAPAASLQCRSPKTAFQYGVNVLSSGAWSADGEVVIGTRIFGNVPFDFGGKQIVSNGSADVLVAKLNPASGAATWVLTSGVDKDQAATSVATTSAGIAVAGFFKASLDLSNGAGTVATLVNPSTSNNYAFLANLKTADGTATWAKAVNLGTGAINQIAGDYNKDYFLVCGSTSTNAAVLNATGTPAGGKDVLLAAVKADGTVLWAKIFGTTLDEECMHVAMDASGNAIFGGYYLGALDLGAGPFVAAPATTGVKLIWVAKLNGATGALMAAKAYGTGGLETVNAIATDAKGDVAMVGQLTEDTTFGATTLAVKSGADAFAVKLSGADLTPVWARRWGDQAKGTNGASASAAAFDSAGALVVAGQFGGSIDIGGAATVDAGAVDGGAAGVIASVSTSDLFVATLDGTRGNTACVSTWGDATPAATAAAGAVLIDRGAAGADGDRVAIIGAFQKILDFGKPTTPMSAAIAGYLLGL